MPNTRLLMDEFFVGIQKKALRQIEFSLGDRDEAMDILQEAMLRLAKHYSTQPQDWPKLLQRIMQNLICDWHRRKKVRSILVWWQGVEGKHSEEDALDHELITHNEKSEPLKSPEDLSRNWQVKKSIEKAIRQLPLRQQQAFTLRAWWGHDTQDTAFAMGCSEGSVKTHYSRAIAKLRELLGDACYE